MGECKVLWLLRIEKRYIRAISPFTIYLFKPRIFFYAHWRKLSSRAILIWEGITLWPFLVACGHLADSMQIPNAHVYLVYDSLGCAGTNSVHVCYCFQDFTAIHTIQRWSELNWASHWVVFASWVFYCLIK